MGFKLQLVDLDPSRTKGISPSSVEARSIVGINPMPVEVVVRIILQLVKSE